MQKEIVRRETRFAVHLPKTGYREDCHYVKERVFYSDGTEAPRSFLVKDFQRPVWVTAKAHRSHRDKLEFFPRSKTMEQKCTQSDINRVVAGLLGEPHLVNRPDEIKNSPYVYGYDQTSTSLIKLQNLLKNKFIQSPYVTSTFDIETDIDTREILMASICLGEKMYTVVLRKYLKNIPNVDERVQQAIQKYLPEYADKLQLKIAVHDDEVSLLKDVFRVANEWGPDFLSIWHMNFDIPRCLERLKAADVNPIDVICDQSVPRNYRVCRYKEGITKKVTASGKVKPVNPSLQWHSLIATASFYAIDAMCVYRQLRMAKQEEPSYSLDAILQKELKKRKLTFREADDYKGANWHRFMQQQYPIEYIVYHLYDCLGMQELETKLKDVSQSLPAAAGMTDFMKFNSNPKKIVDALFLFGLERGEVIGTVGKLKRAEEDADGDLIDDDLVEDGEDDDVEESVSKYNGLGLKGWIQMLQQNLLLNEGLKCLEDFPDVVTNVRGMTWDVDATAAYPTCTQVANVSKATCVNELIRVDGVAEEVFKEQNLSVCMGPVSTLEYYNVLYSLPSIDEINLDEYF